MATTENMPSSGAGHPSPGRRNVSLISLYVGLVGAPLAWSVQIILGYGIAAHACFPRRLPLAEPIYVNLKPVLWWISGATILVALVCTLVAWRSWKQTRDEKSGKESALMEAGEGRSRFMAMSGLLASGAFFLALIFTTIVLFMVKPCAM